MSANVNRPTDQGFSKPAGDRALSVPRPGLPHAGGDGAPLPDAVPPYQELQLPLSTFDGSDWTPWVGEPTHEELKARTAAAIQSYRGPRLEIPVGTRRFVLGHDERQSLLEAIATSQESQGEQLADIWRLVRSQDTRVARPDSRSWPALPFAHRLQQAASATNLRTIADISPAPPAVGGSAWSIAGGRSWEAAQDAAAPINEPIWPRPAVPGRVLPLQVVRRPEALWSWRSRWDELRVRSDLQGAEFDQVLQAAQDPAQDFALLALGDIQHPAVLLALTCRQMNKRFTLGERRIASTTVRQATLIGGHALGEIDAQRLAQLLRAAQATLKPDLFNLPEIETASPSYRAARSLGWPHLISSHSRTDQLHWTIDLPASFDGYLEQLSSKTRQSVRYSIRKAAKHLQPTIERVSRPEQVEGFLRDAESISRRTYQWQVGERVQYGDAMRAEYLRRAHEGTLRAYLMRVDGVPVAFARGELRGDRYDYETPGYLPEYSKWSVGTVLLMHSIEDLIRGGECRVFDFGEGGDTHGYKARFGNHSTPVRSLDIARLSSAWGACVVLLQACLSGIKNLAQRLVGESDIKRRIKAWLRS